MRKGIIIGGIIGIILAGAILICSLVISPNNDLNKAEEMWSELENLSRIHNLITDTEDYNNKEIGKSIHSFHQKYYGETIEISGIVYRNGAGEVYISNDYKEDERGIGAFDNKIFRYPLLHGRTENHELIEKIEELEYMKEVTLVGTLTQQECYPPILELIDVIKK